MVTISDIASHSIDHSEGLHIVFPKVTNVNYMYKFITHNIQSESSLSLNTCTYKNISYLGLPCLEMSAFANYKVFIIKYNKEKVILVY